MEKKNDLKKTVINLIIFILLIILTFMIIFRNQDITQIIQIALDSKWQYILIAIFAISLYIVSEAINVRRILKTLHEKTNIISAIKYTLIGFFFSSITPAATGGQPMEIYYMYKDNVKVSHSTLTLLMQLCSMQIVTITIGIISAIVNYEVLKSGLIYLFILGIFFNLIALSLLIIGIFSKRMSVALVNLVGKILKLFRVKNIEEKQEKMRKELASYQRSAKFIKKHRWLMIKTVLTTIVQMLAYYSVPYWIYKALGFNSCTLWQIITLQATLYATVSCIPLPGSVGASEGGFLGIFKNVYSENIIGSAMLLSRGINFYLLIIISFAVVIITRLKSKNNRFPPVEKSELKGSENIL